MLKELLIVALTGSLVSTITTSPLNDDLMSDSTIEKFKENYLKVETFNKKSAESLHFSTRLNEFAGMSHSEFISKYLNKNLNESLIGDMPGDQLEPTMQNDYKQIPSRYDWRDYGLVTPVKHQGSCGTCWSFANAGAVETLHGNKFGQLVELSKQELNDCLWTGAYRNWGCNGGWPANGFWYAMNTGLVAESVVPYKSKDLYCPTQLVTKRYKIRGYAKIPYGDENAIKTAVATYGPVAVALDASDWGFAYYSSGVYSSTTCQKNVFNHAVLIVGYGTEGGLDYWVIKNSWGTRWGQRGFMKLARGKNMCGVASLASYAYL